MTLGSAQLRQHFLDFFRARGHAVVKSSSLVPSDDPTLLFTNAGMVQFKDVFVGRESRPYCRAATAQKCMRVSGKHNDLEEVGRTARHHTFFEMLGNFSFGDYFKDDAIAFAWQFLTGEMGLARERLWITVFAGADGVPADDEARQLWKKVTGLGDDRILALGMKDNFWAMGDTGPCGPCTEIHYDLGGPGLPTLADFQTGRVIELWNNVFMQFERLASGELVPLPKPSVDTGMGLERLTGVLQGKTSNYHSDLFMPLLQCVAEQARKPYCASDSEDDVAMRVIADHARATAFLTADGVQPLNEGRGYVMRRIMRRAIRFGRRLGMEDLFLHRACLAVVDTMGAAYPELVESRALIEKLAQTEETSFRRTLDTGLQLLDDAFRGATSRELKGDTVFKLYDTYGFPKDLTELIAQERGFAVDHAGFDGCMAEQRERSRGAAAVAHGVVDVYPSLRERVGATHFVGYTHEDEPLRQRDGEWRLLDGYLEARCTVLAIVDERGVGELSEAGPGVVDVVLNPTPFYGESGGQVGDRGRIVGDNGLRGEVLDTRRPLDDLTLSRVRILAGQLKPGARVWAGYSPDVRKLTRAHHSATHLLHRALRQALGEHVKQAGSHVDPDHLRFDFSHFEALSRDQLRAIEDRVNDEVLAAHAVATEELPFDAARARGALAFFGDRYGDVVRMVTMGASIELCGGTHVKSTGDIELVLVMREEAVAAGVRRMEAQVAAPLRRTVTQLAVRLAIAQRCLAGDVAAVADDRQLQALAKAVRQNQEQQGTLRAQGEVAQVPVMTLEDVGVRQPIDLHEARRIRDQWQALLHLLGARGADAEQLVAAAREFDRGGLLAAVARLIACNEANDRTLQKKQAQAAGATAADLLQRLEVVGGVKLLAATVKGVDGKTLRVMADHVRERVASGIVCLVSEHDDKASLLIAVTPDLHGRFQAGALVRDLAPCIDGRGGGKSDLAQAGGSNPRGADELFKQLRARISP